MKKIIGAMLLFVATASHAGHLDVISFTLKDDCSLAKYLEIVSDFNEWAGAYGYQTEIAVPVHQNDLQTIGWLGRSANAETFGKAYDAWSAGLRNNDSVPAQLAARFSECGNTNESRHAYQIFS